LYKSVHRPLALLAPFDYAQDKQGAKGAKEKQFTVSGRPAAAGLTIPQMFRLL
jgi:hypothetical protein